jgi:hypothetical protein
LPQQGGSRNQKKHAPQNELSGKDLPHSVETAIKRLTLFSTAWVQIS